jgi:hypothetical protein
MRGEHVKNSAGGAGRLGPSARALKKWSELRREEKVFIAAAAMKMFDAYVAEHGRNPYLRAMCLMAYEVRGAVRKRGIILPKKIMDNHVVKFLSKLAKGGSRFEVRMRKAPADKRGGDAR